MADDVNTVGIGKKITSVVLLLVGSVALYGMVLGVVASVLQPRWPDGTFWLLSVITAGVGIGLVIGGAVLWNRWRLPLAAILLFLGIFTVPKILGLRSGAAQSAGAQAGWLTLTAGAFVLVAVVLALSGVFLFAMERRRRHASDRQSPWKSAKGD